MDKVYITISNNLHLIIDKYDVILDYKIQI